MKVAKKVKVGDVIQFPRTQFAPLRSGWNGWLFSAGIIEKLYISKSGKKCATVRYCTRRAGRYQLLPNVETTIYQVRTDSGRLVHGPYETETELFGGGWYTMGALYDNKEDCIHSEHSMYDAWEELRELQQKESAE